jgi:hypothetical protein
MLGIAFFTIIMQCLSALPLAAILKHIDGLKIIFRVLRKWSSARWRRESLPSRRRRQKFGRSSSGRIPILLSNRLGLQQQRPFLTSPGANVRKLYGHNLRINLIS